ncbi:type II toxin-antitoxin system RelB family antitoxin [Desulfonatronovibrio magnus]|uniref:type II toxin-antitoxin system RelB family antitoxin n=1 Tax=Desulfonatronovibrio magnus TaxID=698827 RepID=UPI0005EBE9FC|nr:ribbon-helix-helix protein, CopG family [Desulfonatronovibrio magnus]
MPASVRLPDDVDRRLTFLAKTTGRSKAYYIKEAIVEHLDLMEDIYLAEKRLDQVKSGLSKIFTLEEVEKDLGLASKV